MNIKQYAFLFQLLFQILFMIIYKGENIIAEQMRV